MLKELFTSVMDMAEQLLLSGAEIYRIEESINRIFAAYSVKRVDSYITTSSMVVSVYDNDGSVLTQTRRISSIGTPNIEKIHKLNALSRYICENTPSYEQINYKLAKIKNIKRYPFWLCVLANALVAGSFAMFFGGSLVESLCAFFVGALMQVIYKGLSLLKINKLLEKFFASLVLTMLSIIIFRIGIIPDIDKVIIGNIMSMIPGVGFTTSLRDLFKGDIYTGVHGLIESLLVSISIAAAYVLVVILAGGVTL